MYVYIVCYKDKDGFYVNSVDALGRNLVSPDHTAALEALVEQSNYLESLLKGRVKYVARKKHVLGIPLTVEIVEDGKVWEVPEHEKERITRELKTIGLRKVRIFG